jgi:lysozyme family protein
MAQFNLAYNITMKNEGGYANNPNDHGGETWRGIARNFWGTWPGWKIVDSIKAQKPANLNAALAANSELEDHVLAFYKKNFWDTESLDNINDQQVANQLFDTAVNMGTGTASKFLQQGVNTITPNALTVDGQIGSKTISAANSIQPQQLYNAICAIRKQRYENIIAANPSQAIFKNSWFSRITPYNPSEANA